MKTLLFAVALTAGAAPAFAEEPPPALQACAACHSTAQGTNGIGPSLFGIVGRKAGSVPGFNYSRAMKTSNVTWSAQDLDAFLTDPQQKVPGNRMPFSGLPDAQQRTAIIEYLQSVH
jgi:cytochrome c